MLKYLEIMYLKPTDIYYCQNSVKNVFQNGKRIGETLDDLCEGRCQLSSFPRIRVSKRDSKWFTTDNRRLWVFRQLYRLGKCGEIPVIETGVIPSDKMTTKNGGISITVRRGGPGGIWYLKPDGAGANADGSFACTWPEGSFSDSGASFFCYDSDEIYIDSDDFDDFGCSYHDSDDDCW